MFFENHGLENIIDRNLVNNFCGPPADLFTCLVSSDMSPPGTEGRTGMTDLHGTLQRHCDPSLLCLSTPKFTVASSTLLNSSFVTLG